MGQPKRDSACGGEDSTKTWRPAALLGSCSTLSVCAEERGSSEGSSCDGQVLEHSGHKEPQGELGMPSLRQELGDGCHQH